jgi:hypothetical protein
MRLDLKNFLEKKVFSEGFWVIYTFQGGLVLIYLLAFGLAYLRDFTVAGFLVSPLLASVYFLVIKLVTHRLSLLWTILSTFFFTLAIDIIIPIFTGNVQTLFEFLDNFWLVLILVVLEILLEEEVELIEHKRIK